MNINSFKSFYLVGRLLLIFTVLNFSSFIFCSLPSRDAEHATQEAVSALNGKNLESFNRAIDVLIKIVEVPGSGGEHAVYIRFVQIIKLLKNFEWDRSDFLVVLKKLGRELVKRKIVTSKELKELEDSIITAPVVVNLPVGPIVLPPISPDPTPIPPDPTPVPNFEPNNWITLKKVSYLLIPAILLALGISSERFINYLKEKAERDVQPKEVSEREAEEKRLREEETARRDAEERRLREEEEIKRQAEVDRRAQEETARRDAEERRLREEEERKRQAEVDRRAQEETTRRDAEEKRLREERKRQEAKERQLREEEERNKENGVESTYTKRVAGAIDNFAKGMEGRLEVHGGAAKEKTLRLKREDALEKTRPPAVGEGDPGGLFTPPNENQEKEGKKGVHGVERVEKESCEKRSVKEILNSPTAQGLLKNI